jgi:hypothetical protein
MNNVVLKTEGGWGNDERGGICARCSKEEDRNDILRCEVTEIWKEEILDKRLCNAEVGVWRIRRCKNK